ncbi:hypothetical protein MKX08_004838 [Trichoderma sp. CBMAI-0020]|nr:hypothetical protein MKX08_004838 [Trichoderma sp. CBMAI-0020]
MAGLALRGPFQAAKRPKSSTPSRLGSKKAFQATIRLKRAGRQPLRSRKRIRVAVRLMRSAQFRLHNSPPGKTPSAS